MVNANHLRFRAATPKNNIAVILAKDSKQFFLNVNQAFTN